MHYKCLNNEALFCFYIKCKLAHCKVAFMYKRCNSRAHSTLEKKCKTDPPHILYVYYVYEFEYKITTLIQLFRTSNIKLI